VVAASFSLNRRLVAMRRFAVAVVVGFWRCDAGIGKMAGKLVVARCGLEGMTMVAATVLAEGGED
jgi:hypothetical protein